MNRKIPIITLTIALGIQTFTEIDQPYYLQEHHLPEGSIAAMCITTPSQLSVLSAQVSGMDLPMDGLP